MFIWGWYSTPPFASGEKIYDPLRFILSLFFTGKHKQTTREQSITEQEIQNLSFAQANRGQRANWGSSWVCCVCFCLPFWIKSVAIWLKRRVVVGGRESEVLRSPRAPAGKNINRGVLFTKFDNICSIHPELFWSVHARLPTKLRNPAAKPEESPREMRMMIT